MLQHTPSTIEPSTDQWMHIKKLLELPWQSVVKTLPSSARGACSIPGWGA